MGRLVVAAVPLGNPGDASLRLREAIESAPIVVAEDSRKFARLCQELGIATKAKVISFFEGNELARMDELLTALAGAQEILLVTDAGLPAISDPGYRVIAAALQAGHDLAVLPGPSAVTTALLHSGLPTDRFTFEGFLPRTEIARQNYLTQLAHEVRTMVFFEAPHRITAFLTDAIDNFGAKRRAAICREMTKRYEEIVRGELGELLDWSKRKEMLGEFTIVIAGFDPDSISYSDQDVLALVLRFEATGITRKEAIALAAKELAMPKRKVFDILVANK